MIGTRYGSPIDLDILEPFGINFKTVKLILMLDDLLFVIKVKIQICSSFKALQKFYRV